MNHCDHPAVDVVEVGPLHGSYQAHCPSCSAAGPEAVTVDQALSRFHALHGGRPERFAGDWFSDRPEELDH